MSGFVARMLIGQSGPRDVKLFDVSKLGCRVERIAEALVGKTASFTFAGNVEAQGWVVWTNRFESGVEFTRPLSDEELVRLDRSQWSI